MNLLTFAVTAVFPVYAVRPGPLGLSEGAFGLLLLSFAVGSVAGSLLAARLEDRFGRRPLLVACACAMPLQALFAVPNVLLIAAVSILVGLFGVVWNVITVSLRQRIVPDHLLGRLNAAYRLLAWGTLPIGALLGGVLAEAFGVQATFVICGAFALVLVPLGLGITEQDIRRAEGEVVATSA
jgi:MFS family permease